MCHTLAGENVPAADATSWMNHGKVGSGNEEDFGPRFHGEGTEANGTWSFGLQVFYQSMDPPYGIFKFKKRQRVKRLRVWQRQRLIVDISDAGESIEPEGSLQV